MPPPSRTTKSSCSAACQCGGQFSFPGAMTTWRRPVRTEPGGGGDVALGGVDLADLVDVELDVLQRDAARRARRGLGQLERAGGGLALERVVAGGLEPDPGRGGPCRRAAGARAAGRGSRRRRARTARRRRRSGVSGPAGEVDERVAGADLVHRAVDPGQARAREHEEDLLLGAVLVHRPGAAAGLDVDAAHADRGRARGARRARGRSRACRRRRGPRARRRPSARASHLTVPVLDLLDEEARLIPRSPTLPERGKKTMSLGSRVP